MNDYFYKFYENLEIEIISLYKVIKVFILKKM